MAAEMGAGGREGMKAALVVAIGCNFLQAVADDLALAALDLVVRADFGRRDIFGEVLHRGDVLADECAERARGFAVRRIKVLPQLAALHDGGCNDEAADDAVRDALAGITGVNVDALVAGIAPA